jgi:hypothetical protein
MTSNCITHTFDGAMGQDDFGLRVRGDHLLSEEDAGHI